jgi:integrase
MNAEKVVKLNSSRVYEDISIFLKELDASSGTNNTRKAYETDIRDFFQATRGKSIEHLTESDLVYRRNDVLQYRQRLMDGTDPTYTNLTINRKMSAISSLFESLAANDYKINTTVFKIKSLKVKVNSYGNLSQTEAERFAEMAYTTERELREEKRLLILFAIRTSFRKEEILNVKWTDFRQQNGVYVVKTIGKGQKERETSISCKLYNELLSLKTTNDKEYVFNISDSAIDAMMNRLRKKMNIDPSRNIAFHSFRKVAIDWELEATGDVKKATIHSGHSSMDTLYQYYANKNVDYSQMPGVRMEEEVDLSILDQLSREDLLYIIKSSDLRTIGTIVSSAQSLLNSQ